MRKDCGYPGDSLVGNDQQALENCGPLTPFSTPAKGPWDNCGQNRSYRRVFHTKPKSVHIRTNLVTSDKTISYALGPFTYPRKSRPLITTNSFNYKGFVKNRLPQLSTLSLAKTLAPQRKPQHTAETNPSKP